MPTCDEQVCYLKMAWNLLAIFFSPFLPLFGTPIFFFSFSPIIILFQSTMLVFYVSVNSETLNSFIFLILDFFYLP